MKRVFAIIMSFLMLFSTILMLSSCGEKNITVIVREDSSGTREAFDSSVIKNGIDLKGKITHEAIIHNKTGLVLSAVREDKNAIGYVSLGSVDDTVNIVKINGVEPTSQSVLDKEYAIERPFVILTTEKVPLTVRAEDFLKYLKSSEAKKHADASGTIFVDSPERRGDNEPINVVEYSKRDTLPEGEKIVIRGSTSMEKFISSAIKGYADLYNVKAEDIFDIELQGSSVGISTVEKDGSGNVIGLSSVAVNKDGVEDFNVCLEAIAVIVNKDNKELTDLTIEELYDIFTGKTLKFDEVKNTK